MIAAFGPTGAELGGTLSGKRGKGCTPPIIKPGTWHHGVWVSHGYDLQLYVDGVRQPLMSANDWDSPFGVFVGSMRDDTKYDFAGSIDELMRFDTSNTQYAVLGLDYGSARAMIWSMSPPPPRAVTKYCLPSNS